MTSSQEPNNITITRRQGLKHLLMEFTQAQVAQGKPAKGIEQAFAAALQVSPSLLSQIKSSRPIGDKLARQIERACGQPVGYLDAFEEQNSVAPNPAEESFLTDTRRAWALANAKEKRELARQMKVFVAMKTSTRATG